MAYFGENAIFAWAQANHDSVSMRDSYNMTSVVDVGTGRLGFNLATAAPNNDYAFCALAGNATGQTTSGRTINNDATMTTTYFAIRILNMNSGNAPIDDNLINVIVVSDT